ncbi:MAG TPA: PrsW family glutamic-type intramembrane protease [Steroidobacteraceae bacterium]|jgi:RsiW-degrading membrane proteinase PrsW (M82 family)
MSNSQLVQPTAGSGNQTRLAFIAGGTMLFSAGIFIASQLGAMPSGVGTTLVLIGMAVVLKLAWNITSKSANSAERARFAMLMSNVALIIALLSALAALPRVTKAAGMERFIVDLAAQLWTVALLFAAAGPARTLGWRALLGAFLLGFLGLMGLARFVGRPVIVALGNDSLFAAAVWVPVTEEIFKLLPLGFMLFFALRRKDVRPSLLDVVLLTACAAAGFAVSENASYGRGGFSLGAAPLVSLLSPAANHGAAYGWPMVQTGHLLHSALIGLALGFVALYRDRLPRFIAHAWMVPAVAIGAVLVEHCSQNAIVTGRLNSYVGEFCIIITLGGRLCALLLALGVGYVITVEWRAFLPLSPSKEWILLSLAEARRRAARLALLQR